MRWNLDGEERNVWYPGRSVWNGCSQRDSAEHEGYVKAHRSFNSIWKEIIHGFCVLQMELYSLFAEKSYLKHAYQTTKKYYSEDGHKFYAVGIPMSELLEKLRSADMQALAEDLTEDFIRHAEYIRETGNNYPPFEVKYEQSIVAPAVGYLLEGYKITGEEKYLEEAGRQMTTLLCYGVFGKCGWKQGGFL